jgi:hypothetical protein
VAGRLGYLPGGVHVAPATTNKGRDPSETAVAAPAAHDGNLQTRGNLIRFSVMVRIDPKIAAGIAAVG